MSETDSQHPVTWRRAQRGWSQAELARRARIPRTTISAIEGRRLTPSVNAALLVAQALQCSVEELFGGPLGPTAGAAGPEWAWPPRFDPHRYWEAEVGGRRRLYPVEGLALNAAPHDGLWQDGVEHQVTAEQADKTIVMACCDPAAGLLATEYARATGFRLIVLPRGGGEALDLLGRGLAHVAGLHRSTSEKPDQNLAAVRAQLGDGYHLVRAAHWQEGLAVAGGRQSRSTQSVLRRARCWALREPGSAAQECLEELRGGSTTPGRTVRSHAAVAQAVSAGWADAGVCVRLAAEEAGLDFRPIRTEMLDFCFADAQARDPRLASLLRVLRSRGHRQLISELPGYDARQTGEMVAA